MTKSTKATTTATATKALIASVKADETAKLNLTDEQLLNEVIERYEAAPTKSAMLKQLRADNFKVSQDRCYNMYLRYAKSQKVDAKA